jgi:hypothetical protein
LRQQGCVRRDENPPVKTGAGSTPVNLRRSDMKERKKICGSLGLQIVVTAIAGFIVTAIV